MDHNTCSENGLGSCSCLCIAFERNKIFACPYPKVVTALLCSVLKSCVGYRSVTPFNS
ncbi:hypothetical protein M413DRAFT_364009 [Hebeloma cylindrosporum]|uniref:Uncharacterized protein n=1 Tax=Hebeloma cylindrosporum TaxID=76867 RepID=A0A0C3CM49_HEBCY|nr:hypothetical protein M413DRAFT_364009 [Hebeloma cylindrosporum h7]